MRKFFVSSAAAVAVSVSLLGSPVVAYAAADAPESGDVTATAASIEHTIMDTTLRGGGGGFSGTCPASHPYVKRYTLPAPLHGVKNDLSPGRITPGGVRVLEPGGVAVSTYADFSTEEIRVFDNTTYRAYKGVEGNYMPWFVINPTLKINLQCVENFWDGATAFRP